MAAPKTSAARYLPQDRGLESLKNAAERCHGCPLFADATQTVFGHGHRGAPIMLVGEQPGDQEDRAGLPFVGPAGAAPKSSHAARGSSPRSRRCTRG
jgi:uracil-DNA glycosylase